MSLLIRSSSRSEKKSLTSMNYRIGKNTSRESDENDENLTILLDDILPTISYRRESSTEVVEPSLRDVSPSLFSPSARKDNSSDSVDIFDMTDESPSKTIVLSSPEPSRTPMKERNSPPSSKSSPISKQASLDKFVMHNFSKTSAVSRKRGQQSKMDLFVKWKDPSKLERADKARDKFFNNVNAPEVNNSSWTVSQSEIAKKFEALPMKKRVKKRNPQISPKKNVKKAPKPLQPKKMRSDDSDFENSDFVKEVQERRLLLKKVMTNKRKEESGSILSRVQKEQQERLKDGQVIRKQADRQRMHGTDCACCKDYYDALGLSPDSRQRRVQQSSRHRYVENPKPKTPEHYWDLKFPSSSEKRRISPRKAVKKTVTPKKLF